MKYNKFIDHTLLRQDAKPEEIERLCQEAREYSFMSVCVNPFFVAKAKKLLEGSDVKVCTVIGFPLGANVSAIKVQEAIQAVKDGAVEIDMVQNVSMAKAHDYSFIESEIHQIKQAIGNNLLKVILETCLLIPEEIRECSLAAKRAGADFVKTSTGFSKGGASIEAVKIMREAVGPEMGVKASGGIHTRQEMLALIEAGASRIGASCGVALMQD